MNLSTLRSQVRFKANISSTTTLSNDDIDTHINDAQNKMVQRMVETNEDFFEEQKSKFDLVASQDLYALPSDCLKFKQLRLAYATPSTEDDYKVAINYNPVNVEDVGFDEENVSSSNPVVDVTNNYMRVKPTPSSAVINGGELYYIARPSALAATASSPVIPVDFHDLLAVYAAARVCQKFENWDKADRLEREFEVGVEKMARAIADRELNFPLRFRNPLETRTRKTTTELYD